MAVVLCALPLGAQRPAGDLEVNRGNFSAGLASLSAECRQRIPASCVALGQSYVSGKPRLPRDHAKAAASFRIACEGGFADGCAHLLMMQLDSLGSRPPRPNEIAELQAALQRLCDGGSGKSCWAATDRQFGLDRAREIELLERGCRLRHTLACNNLGFFHYTLSLEGFSKDSARRMWQMACDDYIGDGCNNLATVEMNKQGPRNWESIFRLFTRSCINLNPTGCEQLVTAIIIYPSAVPTAQAVASFTRIYDTQSMRCALEIGAAMSNGVLVLSQSPRDAVHYLCLLANAFQTTPMPTRTALPQALRASLQRITAVVTDEIALLR